MCPSLLGSLRNEPNTDPFRSSAPEGVDQGLTPTPGGTDASDLLAACLATGAPRSDALAMMGLAHGQDVALPFLLRTLEGKGPNAVVAFLDGVSRLDPELARRGLDGWGQDLKLDGNLDLEDLPWVATLPEGLDIRGRLSIRWCQGWDGRIPGGVKVGERLYTGQHPQGILLDDWRNFHRHGEGHRDLASPTDPNAGLPGWD